MARTSLQYARGSKNAASPKAARQAPKAHAPATPARRGNPLRAALRWLGLLLLAGVLLQAVFALQIGWLRMGGELPSTTFQRSGIWHILTQSHPVQWQHNPVPYQQMGATVKRAVIASEDSTFFTHSGVDWQAIESAWTRNAQGKRILGGSTISQQLAKNLFLSSERSMLRKGQELAITWMMESMLPKERILEIYLNHVEWGLGIYGVQAAARHYFNQSAANLTSEQAARLAVMLPNPKAYGANPHTGYMQRRTRTIMERQRAITLPAGNQATPKGAP